ncbi:hypothetical protein L083_5637 [Actinoplanes sp. N902-109]|nr:hypothetical protein L083_5637 [Actinoplanes sp. N902-109]
MSSIPGGSQSWGWWRSEPDAPGGVPSHQLPPARRVSPASLSRAGQRIVIIAAKVVGGWE